MQSKLERLKKILRRMQAVVVAYSGGVDSSLLAKVAHDVLQDRAIAVTGLSATFKESELRSARQTAAAIGIRHAVVPTRELDNPKFVKNSPKRCFYCKYELFSVLGRYAVEQRMACVAEGSNRDDTADFRPGMRAARLLKIRQPLIEVDLGKQEIRELAKALGLPNWNKPASACLASRLPYGEPVTLPKLRRIEKAEAELRRREFEVLRVRHHGDIARIEVPRKDFARLIEQSQAIVARFKALGYNYVTLDIQGFRSGSLNESLKKRGPEGSHSLC